MQVTRSLKTLWGVHLAAGVFGAAHMAMAVAMAVYSGMLRIVAALSGHVPAVGIENY